MDPTQNQPPTAPLPDPLSPAPVSNVPTSPKKAKSAQLFKIAAVVLGILAVVFLLLTMYFATRSSASQQALNEQFQNGLTEGAKKQREEDLKEFQSQQSSDFRIYKAPSEFGSFETSLPKSWSWAITPVGSSGGFSGIADPDYIDLKQTKHAFKLEIVEDDYEKKKKEFDTLVKDSEGAVKSAEVTVSGIKGMRYSGKIDKKSTTNGEIVIIQARSKTMIFRTDDSAAYLETFNNILTNTKVNP
jgi:hypothetical protein